MESILELINEELKEENIQLELMNNELKNTEKPTNLYYKCYGFSVGYIEALKKIKWHVEYLLIQEQAPKED